MTAKVSAPNPRPIRRSAVSSATLVLLWNVSLLHDQVGDAAEYEDGGDSPQQNDRHGYLLGLPVSGKSNSEAWRRVPVPTVPQMTLKRSTRTRLLTRRGVLAAPRQSVEIGADPTLVIVFGGEGDEASP